MEGSTWKEGREEREATVRTGGAVRFGEIARHGGVDRWAAPAERSGSALGAVAVSDEQGDRV